MQKSIILKECEIQFGQNARVKVIDRMQESRTIDRMQEPRNIDRRQESTTADVMQEPRVLTECKGHCH